MNSTISTSLWTKFLLMQDDPLLCLAKMTVFEYTFLRKMAAGTSRCVVLSGPIDPRTAN